ncbi:alpha-tocopherol transfer protein-like [Periplaneta americana]|uniref:alpha-tocopherol transfer protein-like n=1 Tax=Periplaneta americana TaxID=6978 RepID=UPI0037E7189A
MSVDLLPPATKEIKERVRNQFGLNEQSIREAVQMLRDWLELQPHLPHEPDNERLERWIIRCKNSLERAKKSIDLYFTMKSVTPDLMSNWDTTAQWFKNATSVWYVFPLPELNENDERIVCYGLQNGDPSLYNMDDFFRFTLMTAEIRLCEEYCSSDIYIVDFGKVTLAHVPKFSLPALRKYEVCAMGGFSVRIKTIYIINAAPHVEVVIAMLKTVFKSKIAARIQVYGNDLTSFYDKIPRKILPQELGGEAGTVAELTGRWTQKLESYQKWFLEREHLKSDETKRPSGATVTSDLFGFEGSFRKLTLD